MPIDAQKLSLTLGSWNLVYHHNSYYINRFRRWTGNPKAFWSCFLYEPLLADHYAMFKWYIIPSKFVCTIHWSLRFASCETILACRCIWATRTVTWIWGTKQICTGWFRFSGWTQKLDGFVDYFHVGMVGCIHAIYR